MQAPERQKNVAMQIIIWACEIIDKCQLVMACWSDADTGLECNAECNSECNAMQNKMRCCHECQLAMA
eukprot:1149906-Pelagomonas_calceolata.AAC.2